MSEQVGKPPRWVRVEVNAAVRLPEAGASPPAPAMPRTYELTGAGGEAIGTALATADASGRTVAVAEIRYDADKATEAEARRALERVLTFGTLKAQQGVSPY